ncbi:hypothetical protein AEMCBJ_12965 [Cupriavidus necator]
MQKKAMWTISALGLAAVLAACGGGGDSGSSSSTTTPSTQPAATAEGLYSGTSSSGYQIAGLVLETGEFYVLYGKGSTIYGVVQGNGTSSNGSFSSSNAFDFFLPNSSRIAATVSATYSAKQSLQGTLTEGGQGITFTSSYQSSYDTPASISAIAGTYSGAAATGSGTSPVSLTVKSDGTFSGTSPGASGTCGYSGTVTPRATGKNVFNATVTFNGSNCALGTATVSGYAVSVVSGGVTMLYAVGLLPDRSNGFLAIGTKS